MEKGIRSKLTALILIPEQDHGDLFQRKYHFLLQELMRNGSETDAPPLQPIYHKSFLQQHVDNTSNAGKVCPQASVKLLSAHDFLQRIQTRLKFGLFPVRNL